MEPLILQSASVPPRRPSMIVASLYVAATGACYLALAIAGDLREHPELLLGVLALLGGLYLALLPRVLGGIGAREARLLAAAALAFRLTLLPVTPSLSDDVYRYLWDGKTSLRGVNPYTHAPDDPALAAWRDEAWARVNYPSLPTIYPPAAQLLFAAGALGGSVAGRLLLTKAIMVAGELVLAAGLARLLARRGLGSHLVLVYLLHPLPIVEIAHSGHLEAWPVALLVWAVVAAEDGRRGALVAGMAASILGKVFPVCFVPRVARDVGARGVALLALLLVGAYLPFVSAGPNLFRSFWEYGSRWRWYDTGFGLVLALLRALRAGDLATSLLAALDHRLYATAGRDLVRALYPYAHDEILARAAVATLFAATMLVLAWRRLPLSRCALVAAVAFVVLTPSLHPWYLLWLLPWLAIHPSRTLALLGLLAPLSYATFLLGRAESGSWPEPTALKWCSVGILVVAALAERRARPDLTRRGDGDGAGEGEGGQLVGGLRARPASP